jgi:hypothetical protein
MLKTETLNGRMLRWTPRSGGIGRIHNDMHRALIVLPTTLSNIFFGSGCIFLPAGGFRWIREPGFGRRPAGFREVSIWALVESFGIWIALIPGTVVPIEIGFIVWDPLF